jgi:hypothetical protein
MHRPPSQTKPPAGVLDTVLHSHKQCDVENKKTTRVKGQLMHIHESKREVIYWLQTYDTCPKNGISISYTSFTARHMKYKTTFWKRQFYVLFRPCDICFIFIFLWSSCHQNNSQNLFYNGASWVQWWNMPLCSLLWGVFAWQRHNS